MSACQIVFTPLRGNYSGDYSIIFEKNADEVINDIVDYCFKNNISIKTIDRKTRLVISEPYRINTYTFENPDGTLQNTSAVAVLGREESKPSKNDPYEPKDIQADIVFIVKEEDTKTSMTIRLANMVAYFYSDWCMKEVKSTGFLEKQIIDRMK
jgi:hypothetical protein